MKGMVLFSLVWLLFLFSLFFFSRKTKEFYLFRQTWWVVTGLFLVSSMIAFLKAAFIAKWFNPAKASFFLWLGFLLLALILAVRILAFSVFELPLRRQREVSVPRLVREVVVFVLYVIGLLLILKYYLNIKITLLLASSAVLTVILGLAVQDILGNLFSGIVLNFDDSFKLGNWVRIGEWEGRIEQFGWRSLRVRTIDNLLLVIPNQNVSKSDIILYGERDKKPFACRLRLGVSYRNSPDRVMETILETLDSIDSILKEPAPAVYLYEFGGSSINYEVRYWIREFPIHNKISSEIQRRIWYAFQRNEIQIPFPIRDVYIREEKPPAVTQDDLVEALSENRVLKVLEPERFERLLAGMDSRIYGKGEVIIREAETSDFFYHIHSGQVQILKNMQVLTMLGPGDFFGEISLLTGEKTTATVRAASESLIIRLSAAVFRNAVDMDHNLAATLSEVITQRQSEIEHFVESRGTEVEERSIQRQSHNLLQRIINYFGIQK